MCSSFELKHVLEIQDLNGDYIYLSKLSLSGNCLYRLWQGPRRVANLKIGVSKISVIMIMMRSCCALFLSLFKSYTWHFVVTTFDD